MVQNLPLQSTSFVGRANEITDIIVRLNRPDCRLLTLVGPGGIGKTRLALEVAARLVNDFPDGIFFVPLQPLQLSDQIVPTIMRSLGIQATHTPRDQLLNFLSEKQLLLVIDNLEHLLDGVDILIDILGSAPQVKLLVTSRERLNLKVGYVWPVVGLDLPDQNSVAYNDSRSAVQLFVERAARVKPDFDLDHQREGVVRICRLVEGSPLALELAASWVRAMPCEAIADNIQHDLDFLTTDQRDVPQRHQSMQAVFDHSWHLLTEVERATFPKLAMFRGGFTADAATDIAGASIQILARLIDKSLVKPVDDGRYDLHELVRQHAQERLEASGEAGAVLEAHSHYFTQFLAQRVPDLRGGRQVEAYAEIEADFNNIRQAWHWALDKRDYTLLDQALDGLALHFDAFSSGSNSRELLLQAQQILAPDQDEKPHPVWCRIRVRTSNEDDLDVEPLEQCLKVAREQADQAEIAHCLSALARGYAREDQIARCVQLLNDSLDRYRQLGDKFYAARVLQSLRLYYYRIGETEKSDACAAESLRLKREINDKVGIAISVAGQFSYHRREGRYDQAAACLQQGIKLHRDVGNLAGIAHATAHLSHTLFYKGDMSAAQELAEDALLKGRAVDYLLTCARALTVLGLVGCINENYVQAQAHLHESHLLAPMKTKIYVAWGQAMVACGLGEYDRAKAALYIALSQGHLTRNLATMTICLPIAAILAFHDGHPHGAVELIGLAFTHSASPVGWMEQWPLFLRVRDTLQHTLETEAWDTAWARYHMHDLDAVVDQLLHGLSPEDPVMRANQLLPEPLTPRELEVLRLLAEGLTNAQIAERLFVSIGTIKGHAHHIYSKLAVHDRFHAVLQAREHRLV